MRMLLLMITICSTTAHAAGPVARWVEQRDAFKQVLVTKHHDSYCDWVRFTMLTWGAYLAADHQGEIHNWTSGQVNACRHAIWQYQLVRAFDEDTAEAIGNAQERFSSHHMDSVIDEQNNEAARAMYRRHAVEHVQLGEALQQIIDAVDQQNEFFQTQISEPSSP